MGVHDRYDESVLTQGIMTIDIKSTQAKAMLCSDCFHNIGLQLDAAKLGCPTSDPCPHCASKTGAKLNRHAIENLAHRFFVVGSLHKTEYGGAPIIEFNSHRSNEIESGKFHSEDADLISAKIGIGFFYYGPPLWRIGYVEPLEELQDPNRRELAIRRVLAEYPKQELAPDFFFYRLRKGAAKPDEPSEYDSPPRDFCGGGRLDSKDLPVLYGSADLEVCVHECRVTAEDTVHVASLAPTRALRMLDLTAVLKEDATSFESLDMAVHMMFLAGSHSYMISRAIAVAARAVGFDGIIFPSYFSLLRTGAPFIETAYGLSSRVFSGAAERESAKVIPNVAIFGRPIADGRVAVSCINRIYIRRVDYDLGFGPAST